MVGEVKAPDEGGRLVYIPVCPGGIAAVLAIDRLGLWADPAVGMEEVTKGVRRGATWLSPTLIRIGQSTCWS
jgi:hypothetical protein